MNTLIMIIQIVIALGIFNVWLLRYGKSSPWRGGNASNMKEEFGVYGLPSWFVGVVGFLKILFATLLIAGIWYPVVIQPAALGIAILMAGAMIMHFKIKDPLKKSLPSFTLLIFSLVVVIFQSGTI
jgi:preprotein translocase subunit SecG